MSNKDMVVFELPDGTEVSNDPRFDLEEALTKSLNSRPTTGDVGITWDEQEAMTQATRVAALNAAQEVGDEKISEDPTKDLYGPLGPPAHREQKEDAKEAAEAGGSPQSTTTEDEPPVDANEKVKEVREAKEKAREAHQKALEKLGDDGPGDPNEPYSEWSPKQLKEEILRRNAEEDRHEDDQLEVPRQKAEAAKLLEDDDARQSAGGEQE